ncbi:TonB-dependent siderophore receptor [Mitsuaria sp. 7]|uniref:TonB-dependent receptor n=1 Tax=Mitsuaria sp. 7 TaxID=1658665 RepID=UPI000ADB380B|nr:TonB-dependent receptor plug domain-containing protein [Mitsuaria sp. 7]
MKTAIRRSTSPSRFLPITAVGMACGLLCANGAVAQTVASASSAPSEAASPEPAGGGSRAQRIESVSINGKRAGSVLPDRPSGSVDGLDAAVVDVPRSVFQIDEQQLRREPLRNADDLVRYAPGITRNGGQNVSIAPLIRGQASELFQDGQRTYNVRHPFNTNAFEGVDIVAGPPSQVFGPSSRSGGYANYLAKKPDFSTQRTTLSGSYGSWSTSKLTLDTTGPISDTLAYRVSLTPQRADDYYDGVSNNYNAFYGALAWKPTSKVRVDWNLAYDDYYDFNVIHGWNRATQQSVDSGQYWGGRATPIVAQTVGSATRYYSPVYASGAYNSAITGWVERTPNAKNQFIAGPLLTGAQLPSFLTSATNPGTVRGWVYDPTTPGNGATSISRSDFSNPNDKNTAKRATSQLRVVAELSPSWSLANSTLFQYSKDTGDSVGSFFTQFSDHLLDNRTELRGRNHFELGGVGIDLQSNTGVSLRRESFTTLAANNSFFTAPYDLTAPLGLKTPATIYGLPVPAGSGSWIGTAGVPQQTSFGYLNLPRMYPVANGLYAEAGGSATVGGATYTARGDWTNTGVFTQLNTLVDGRFGLNVGVSATKVNAHIENPLAATAAQVASDDRSTWLPAAQVNLLWKPTEQSTIYATVDRSYAINTGGFADVLTWGANNQLNPLAFRSLSNLREFGAKADLIPGRLFASLAYYKAERDLSPAPDGSIARLRIHGTEAAIRAQLSNQLSAGLNASAINARYDFVSFGSGGFFSPWGFVADNATVFGDGNVLNKRPAPGSLQAPGIPKHSASGFVDYQLENGLGTQLSAWWTSAWYTSITQTVKVPSEHAFDWTLYYRQPRYEISLTVRNLTNEKNYSAGLTGTTNEFLVPSPSRSAQVSVVYHF